MLLLCIAPVLAVVSPAGPVQHAAKKPATGQTAPAARPASDIVGSVNGHTITWPQLLENFRQDSPDGFYDVVGQAIGTEAARQMFGTTARQTVTLTRADAMAALRKSPPRALVSQLGYMLRDEALRQEAAKNNITVTPAQVQARIKTLLDEARKQGQIPPGVTDAQFLATRHITSAKMNSDITAQLQAYALVQKQIEAQLGHPIGPDDFLKARHILIMTTPPGGAAPADPKKADADALAKIKQIEADIRSGKTTFEAAAKQNSMDGSKDSGGDLGTFMRGMMVKEFETSAFSLKEGEMSGPVKSQFGYHLIRVDKVGKDLTPAERQDALERAEQQKVNTYVTQLLTQRDSVVNLLAPTPQPGPQGGGQG